MQFLQQELKKFYVGGGLGFGLRFGLGFFVMYFCTELSFLYDPCLPVKNFKSNM